MLNKYLRVFSIGWSNSFVYRLNFVMWRLRTIIQFLSIYFIWLAVLKNQTHVFGYTAPELLTYILGSSLLRAMVFSSQSMGVQADISTGDLSNYLLKPLNYFGYWLSRDIADKLLNILFSLSEITLFILLLRPPFTLPPSLISGLAFALAAGLAILLYFFFSFIVSLTVFWMPESGGWPQRFLVMTLMEFFSGSLFPLNILPAPIYQVVSRLPTAYFIYVPLEIYNGRLVGQALGQNLLIMVFWLVTFYFTTKLLYHRGLTIYGAYGR